MTSIVLIRGSLVAAGRTLLLHPPRTLALVAPDRLSAPAGPPAVRLLQQAVAARQASDPLAPVTVVVPSNYSALALRRLLGSVAPGLVNVAFVVLGRLAELLGGPVLARAGRRPLSPAVLAQAVRRAVAADPGIFKEVSGHPATEQSLVRAYRDLRGHSPPALDQVARHSERAADVVRLVRSVRARLRDGWYDDVDLVRAAVSPGARQAGAVIAFGLGRLTPDESALLHALDAAVIDAELDLERAPPADVVIGAPDPDQEVRAVVRGVMARVGRGVPLHRMAVLYPAAQPYALLLTQQMAAAGLPVSGPAVRRLRDSVAGVTLLGLLRLPECGWRREDVVAWLASAPVLDADGEAVPSAAWDRASREAGVVEGAEQWQERLGRHAAALAERLAACDEGDADEGTRARIERGMARVDGLRRFMAELVPAAAPPSEGSWTALAEWAGALLDRVLGGEGAHRRWPEEEQEGWRQVRSALDRLAGLDVLSPDPVDLSTFVRALEQELDAPAGKLGTFGDGVFVAPLGAARGTDFDTVFVLGLAEGTLPSPDQRTGLLPVDEDPVADDHDRLLAALAAGRERVLLWPRFDPRRSRERLPSRWLLSAVSGMTGQPVLSEADLRALDDSRVQIVESFEAGLLDTGDAAAGLADYDLAALARWRQAGGAARNHFLAAELPRLATGFEAAAGRTGARLTRFDGLVGADASAAAGLGAVMSPTSLEVYATCPMRYFLRQVLRVAATDKPEEILRLRPMDKGTLVHTILERYVRTLLEGQPRSLDRLLALAEEAFAELEARGLAGKALYWRYERELLVRELRRFYDEDVLSPIAAELVFGMEGAEPVVVALDDGRELRFRGSADRVDTDPATGELVVTDYKTGSSREYEDLRKHDDPVDRGRRLQLPLYALAAGGGEGPVRARYWFTSEKGRFESIGYVVDEPVLARLREVLTVIADGISAGVFPARPGDVDRQTYKNCAYCDYDRLCQRDRGRQWERKRTATVLAGYVALAEGEGATDD
jgi:ATP-dependent helicase/nuclease subunit B